MWQRYVQVGATSCDDESSFSCVRHAQIWAVVACMSMGVVVCACAALCAGGVCVLMQGASIVWVTPKQAQR